MIDQAESWPRRSHRVKYRGIVVTLAEDELTSPAGEPLTREFIDHPGSVAILALDEQGRIAVVHQYRHPLQMRMVEPPAGLLDVPGEAPLAAAKRELAEEAGLGASDWRVLVDFCSSPGISDEVARIFLARGLGPVPRPAGFKAHAEEADMGLSWLPLADGLAAVRAGQVHNVALVLGLNALGLARAEGRLDQLPPGDAPWPIYERVCDSRNERGDA